MPTSRYESYPLPKDTESKEEIVGEDRVDKQLGSLAIELAEDED